MRINGMSAIPPPGFSRSDMNDDMIIYLYVWIFIGLVLLVLLKGGWSARVMVFVIFHFWL